MSRTYDLELSCGCLIGTVDQIMLPCMLDDCKADAEYFDKYVDDITKDKNVVQKKTTRLNKESKLNNNEEQKH